MGIWVAVFFRLWGLLTGLAAGTIGTVIIGRPGWLDPNTSYTGRNPGLFALVGGGILGLIGDGIWKSRLRKGETGPSWGIIFAIAGIIFGFIVGYFLYLIGIWG
jgi:hypothetical protein